MYERAATNAAVMAHGVAGDQMRMVTPCSQWDVSALLEHMSGGAAYLMGAMGVPSDGLRWPDPAVVTACADALRRPGALERRCLSPVGFEWSVAEAAGGPPWIS
jgi:hypothetical protein